MIKRVSREMDSRLRGKDKLNELSHPHEFICHPLHCHPREGWELSINLSRVNLKMDSRMRGKDKLNELYHPHEFICHPLHCHPREGGELFINLPRVNLKIDSRLRGKDKLNELSHPHEFICHPVHCHPREGGELSINLSRVNLKMDSRLRGKDNGFALIEFIIVLIIISICALGITTGATAYHRHQVSLVTSQIKTAIYYAKVQAAATANALILTSIDDDWSKGMQLCIDNPIHKCEVKSQGFIRQWAWNYSNIKVHWHGFFSDKFLLFSSVPLARALNGIFRIETWHQDPIELVINRLGRVHYAKTPT